MPVVVCSGLGHLANYTSAGRILAIFEVIRTIRVPQRS